MNALWRDRTTSERKVLATLAILAAVALVVAFVALPLERSRSRLHAEVPRLRASITVLERQAEEVRRLRAMPAAPAAPAEPLASVTTAGGGRTLPGAQFTVLDARTLAVSGGDVAFGALLDWVAMQAAQGLRVQSAHIEALPAAGRVRAELRLARP